MSGITRAAIIYLVYSNALLLRSSKRAGLALGEAIKQVLSVYHSERAPFGPAVLSNSYTRRYNNNNRSYIIRVYGVHIYICMHAYDVTSIMQSPHGISIILRSEFSWATKSDAK